MALQPMSSVAIGCWAALGAATAWAVAAVLFKQTTERVSPLGLTLVKGLVAVVPLGILVTLGSYEFPARGVGILVLSGVLGIAIGDSLFFAALRELPAHLVVLLGLAGQALTVIGAVAVLGEMPSPAQWLGIALVLGGIAAAFAERGKEDEARTRRGILFGVGSVLAMASGTLIAKVGLESVPALPATLLRLLAGTGGILLLGIVTGRLGAWLRPVLDVRVIRPLAGAILIGTLGGFWLFHFALERADVSLVNAIAASEPLFVMPLAALVLHERIGRRAVFGGLLGVVGLVLLLTPDAAVLADEPVVDDQVAQPSAGPSSTTDGVTLTVQFVPGSEEARATDETALLLLGFHEEEIEGGGFPRKGSRPSFVWKQPSRPLSWPVSVRLEPGPQPGLRLFAVLDTDGRGRLSPGDLLGGPVELPADLVEPLPIVIDRSNPASPELAWGGAGPGWGGGGLGPGEDPRAPEPVMVPIELDCSPTIPFLGRSTVMLAGYPPGDLEGGMPRADAVPAYSWRSDELRLVWPLRVEAPVPAGSSLLVVLDLDADGTPSAGDLASEPVPALRLLDEPGTTLLLDRAWWPR